MLVVIIGGFVSVRRGRVRARTPSVGHTTTKRWYGLCYTLPHPSVSFGFSPGSVAEPPAASFAADRLSLVAGRSSFAADQPSFAAFPSLSPLLGRFTAARDTPIRGSLRVDARFAPPRSRHALASFREASRGRESPSRSSPSRSGRGQSGS